MRLIVKLLAWPVRQAWRLLVALVDWLGEDFRHVVIFGLVLAIALLGWRYSGAQDDRDAARRSAADWKTNAEKWQAAHDRLRTDVALEQLAAAEGDRLNAARVAAEMDTIRERTANVYQDDLADRDAALVRLRRDLAAIDAAGPDGGGAGAPVPPTLSARCRALGAADCDALLAALPDLLAAAEGNTAQLIALQDWARSILLVDYQGEPAQ